MRARLAFPLLAALSLSTTAFAEAPANTIMKVTPPGEKKTADDAALECVHGYRMELARMGALGNELNPTPAQKPLFDAWRKSRLDLYKAQPCPTPPMGLDVPAPQRIQNQITIMSATLAALQKELPAAKALYDALTPEQRKIFDGPIRMAVPPPGAPPPPPAPGH
ncbi:MAG TPA: Spy/CpxP family protein refolding chaperone [Rhizomicrobium sp.]|jgi:hypothetical protein|nr:Spy/CpxP family protein refolding chaperone [Rhizomicrobium sp.]